LQFFANQPILNSGQSHRILRREVAIASLASRKSSRNISWMAALQKPRRGRQMSQRLRALV
jgi:hypothetical protein